MQAAVRTDRQGQTTTSRLGADIEVRKLVAELGLGECITDTGISYLGRNDNWAGITDTGVSIFVKKFRENGKFQRALGFETFASAVGVTGLRSPRCLGHNESHEIIVFERVLDHRSGDRVYTDGEFTTQFAHRMGSFLGKLHSADPARIPPSVGPKSTLPTTERLSELPLASYATASSGELEAWNLIQYDDELHDGLRTLREQEQAADPCPIHADIRLDQFLIDGTSMYLTDWEDFRPGDPARDVGGFVGELLVRAVLAITDAAPADSELSHEEIVARGTHQILKVQPLVSAFWQAYRDTYSSAGAQLAQRATAYAGWHAFERLLAVAQQQSWLPAVYWGAAGIGRKVLLTPGRCAGALRLGDPQ